MAISAKVGTFSTGTGAGGTTVAVTGLGFTPVALFFWWSGQTSAVDNISSGSHFRGIGAATSTSQRWSITGVSIDGGASSDTARNSTASACVQILLSDLATIDGALDLQSLDAGGFTLVVDNAFATSRTISYLALGGADLTAAKAGSFTIGSTGTGNKSYTDPGFQPDFVLLATISEGIDLISTQNPFTIGFAKSSSARGVVSDIARDGQTTTNTYGYGYSGQCLVAIAAATGALALAADFVSMDANGFTLNFTANPGAGVYIFCLALKGGQYAVGDILTQTDTTTDITESIGFESKLTMLASACRAESTANTTTDNDAISLGAFTSASEERVQATWDEDGLADSEVAIGIDFDSSYLFVKDDAMESNAHCTAVGATSWTLRMTDADASQNWVMYWSIGDAAAAGNPWYSYAQQ